MAFIVCSLLHKARGQLVLNPICAAAQHRVGLGSAPMYVSRLWCPFGSPRIKGDERDAQIWKESNYIKAHIINKPQIHHESIVHIVQRGTKWIKLYKIISQPLRRCWNTANVRIHTMTTTNISRVHNTIWRRSQRSWTWHKARPFFPYTLGMYLPWKRCASTAMGPNSNGHFNRTRAAVAAVSVAPSTRNRCSSRWWLSTSRFCQQRLPFWKNRVPFWRKKGFKWCTGSLNVNRIPLEAIETT